MTLTMTYIIFSETKDNSEGLAEEGKTIDLIDYIRPQNYIFSFGDLFIKLYDDTYEGVEVRKSYEGALTSFLSSPSEFLVAETREGVWQEQIQKRSMQINYPVALPLKNFLELYHFNMKTIGEMEDIHVTSVLFLLNHKDYIYIFDEHNNKYFKLSGDASSQWIDQVFSDVDAVKSMKDAYRTIESRYNFLNAGLAKYNLEKPNLLLTPISTEIVYPKYNIVQEISLDKENEGRIKTYAENVFREDLDFVKKSVYADTSTIFMLGYGEKVLKINNDGSIEYTVKPDASSQVRSIEFFEGLRESVDQINRMGVPSDTMYLSGYYQVENVRDIETVYLFNYSKNGIPLFQPEGRSGDLIEVRFSNTDLIKIKKNTPIVINEQLTDFQSAKSFKSIIERNQILFQQNFKEDLPELYVEDADVLQMALHNMELLSLKYYIRSETLVPVWYVKIAKTHYFIDLTSGLVLNYYSD